MEVKIPSLRKVEKNENGWSHRYKRIVLNAFSDIRKGIYCLNEFSFEIPDRNIIVKFGQFNTNWWHVCEYDVAADVNDEEVTLKVFITVEGDTKYYESYENNKRRR